MYENIDPILAPHYEPNYADFHRKLVPDTRYPIHGVRVAVMRSLAKEIAKHPDFDKIIAAQRKNFDAQPPSYEAVMVHLLSIAYHRADLDALVEHTRRSLKYIDNWGICDSFSTTLAKKLLKHPNGAHFIHALSVSSDPWEARCGLVMALSLPVDARNSFIDFLQFHCDEIPFKQTPVSMAIAWLLSQYFFSNRDKSQALFDAWPFDEITLKRTQQKIRESKLNSR